MKLTHHAEARCNQRGIRPSIVQLILENCDRRIRRGGGLVSGMITRRCAESLVRDGRISRTDADRSSGVIVLFDPQTGSCVTTGHKRGRLGRRY